MAQKIWRPLRPLSQEATRAPSPRPSGIQITSTGSQKPTENQLRKGGPVQSESTPNVVDPCTATFPAYASPSFRQILICSHFGIEVPRHHTKAAHKAKSYQHPPNSLSVTVPPSNSAILGPQGFSQSLERLTNMTKQLKLVKARFYDM